MAMKSDATNVSKHITNVTFEVLKSDKIGYKQRKPSTLRS